MIRRQWMRLRSATLMIFVAVIAIGLGGYRWYQATFVQPWLDRAGVVLHEVQPQTDLSRLEARLGPLSGDRISQQVVFRDKGTGKTTTVTIPVIPPTSTSFRQPGTPPVPSSVLAVPYTQRTR